MDIHMNQIHFGLCSMKKSMQNYKKLAISIQKMVPAKFASQHCNNRFEIIKNTPKDGVGIHYFQLILF